MPSLFVTQEFCFIMALLFAFLLPEPSNWVMYCFLMVYGIALIVFDQVTREEKKCSP